MTYRNNSEVRKYLLDVIRAEDDDRFTEHTLREAREIALKEVYRNNEKFWKSERNAIMYWLKGQGIGVAFATEDILEILRGWGYENPTEETYWNLLTGAILYS